MLRKLCKIPDEIFRKGLHFILLGSLLVFVNAFNTWWISAIGCLTVVALAYPVLYFCERFKTYSKVVTERKKGELKNSLIIVFFMFVFVIAICWGWIGDKMLVLASIYAWGFGDAIAALIGTKIGKHKIYKKKSLEGTLAMFITSFITVLIILLIRGVIPWYSVLLVTLLTSLVSTVIELYTPNGLDTVTCPIGAMVVMLPLLCLLGGI